MNKITIIENTDIFSSTKQTITIPVNTVGVMGKGLALQFKQRYPEGYEYYKTLCQHKIIDIGKPAIYKHNAIKWFLLFPTKKHYAEKSKIEYIEAGLIWIVNNYKKEGINSLAVPALGTGAGGLNWEDVYPLLIKYLSKLDIKVEIYSPLIREGGAKIEVIKRIARRIIEGKYDKGFSKLLLRGIYSVIYSILFYLEKGIYEDEECAIYMDERNRVYIAFKDKTLLFDENGDYYIYDKFIAY
jgi:O-acetyl-ADP-ribose deacetylase (regulator of RNase III)